MLINEMKSLMAQWSLINGYSSLSGFSEPERRQDEKESPQTL
jgi:hypothetical protein